MKVHSQPREIGEIDLSSRVLQIFSLFYNVKESRHFEVIKRPMMTSIIGCIVFSTLEFNNLTQKR